MLPSMAAKNALRRRGCGRFYFALPTPTPGPSMARQRSSGVGNGSSPCVSGSLSDSYALPGDQGKPLDAYSDENSLFINGWLPLERSNDGQRKCPGPLPLVATENWWAARLVAKKKKRGERGESLEVKKKEIKTMPTTSD